MLRVAYDVRGIYPDDVNEDLAYRIGYFYGKENGTVVVAHDFRRGSRELYSAIVEGLKAAGSMVYELGTAPTPLLSFTIRQTKADAGIMVTASHNPPQYNGFKLFDDWGAALHPDDVKRILDLALSDQDTRESPDGCALPVDPWKKYEDALPNAERVKVIVDFGNGAGVLYKGLLSKMFDLVSLNDEPDPSFSSRGPEPTFDLAEQMREKILDEGAAFALLLDGDADRSVFSSPSGFTNPSLLFTLFGRWFLDRGMKTFVASLDISPRVRDYLPGARIVRTKIGTSFIVHAAREHSAAFSGEYSCHFTAYELSAHSDPLFFTALLSHYVPLSDQEKKYRFYSLVSQGFPVDDISSVLSAAERLGTVLSRIDGVEFLYKEHRVLVRPSRTEPKVRIYVEGSDAENILREIAKQLNLIS